MTCNDQHKLEDKNHRLQAEVAQLREELSCVEQERIEYLQNVSHQLVAPLNAIKWHIENLTAGRIGVDRAQKVLRSIYSQATITVHLAKNFALMSNLEADHSLAALREPLEPVSLCALLVNLADDFQPFGWDRSIQIGVNEDSFEGVPSILVIKPLMSQVFSNIIENAVKYSDNDSDIQIEGRYDKATQTALVRISNRGIGVDLADKERVFERGVRGERAKAKYPAGTGFGLYIARKIVDIHKGQIRAFADARGRTVFEVSVPAQGLEGLTKQWPEKRS